MPETIHETVIMELYSLLSLLLCEAGDQSRLVNEPSAREGSKNGASLLSKLALSAGSTAGRRGAAACRLAEEGMQTTTCSWYKPIVVHESTNSGRW